MCEIRNDRSIKDYYISIKSIYITERILPLALSQRRYKHNLFILSLERGKQDKQASNLSNQSICNLIFNTCQIIRNDIESK